MSQRSRPLEEADLHAYVDGQMDLDRRASFVQGLAADPEARAKIEGWKRQNEALVAVFGPVLAEQVPVRLLPTNVNREPPQASCEKARLPAERASEPSRPAIRGRSVSRIIGISLGAFLAGAAFSYWAAVSGYGPGMFGSTPPSQSTIPAGYRALALRAYEAHETYVTDLKRPVEIPASDEAHLLRWIQHRLSMPIRIPDLQPQGWTLLGGRVLPGELGPAAFLMYGNGVERLGLYIARTNTLQSDAYSVYENGANLASVAYWVDEPVGYALTISRDSSWLARNGTALYQSVRAQARDNASAF